MSCPCWLPWRHDDASCEVVRAERRDEATADRLLDEVRRALPDLLVVDLTDLAQEPMGGWEPRS